MKTNRPGILVIQADQHEQHCLRADKVYSKWAYPDFVDYRLPKE